MATSVIEQIGSALETAIGEITVANGYAQTLTATRTKRIFLEDEVLKDLHVYLYQGESASQGKGLGSTDARTVVQEYFIWAVCKQGDRATIPIDTKLNSVRSDIEKKLASNPTLGGLCKHLDIVSTIATNIPEAGIELTIELTYCVTWNDPYTAH